MVGKEKEFFWKFWLCLKNPSLDIFSYKIDMFHISCFIALVFVLILVLEPRLHGYFVLVYCCNCVRNSVIAILWWHFGLKWLIWNLSTNYLRILSQLGWILHVKLELTLARLWNYVFFYCVDDGYKRLQVSVFLVSNFRQILN